MAVPTEAPLTSSKETIVLEGATVRLAGDSGDGMQIVGGQFTNTSALHGNDVATFPDFPAEIRAPRGTLAGPVGPTDRSRGHPDLPSSSSPPIPRVLR